MISGSTYSALFDKKKRLRPTRDILADLKNVLLMISFGRSYPRTISRIRMFEASLTKGSAVGLFLPPTLFQKSSAEHFVVFGTYVTLPPASVTAFTPTSPTRTFSPIRKLMLIFLYLKVLLIPPNQSGLKLATLTEKPGVIKGTPLAALTITSPLSFLCHPLP